MPVRWVAWQAELDTLSAFAEEWVEGLAEDFVRNVQNIAAKKRAQKEAMERLSAEVQGVHGTYRELLAFFDLERAFLRWSGENCPDDAVDRVLAVLADWRERLLKFSGKFPPAESEMKSLASLQACIRDAQSAADMIRAGFGALDAYLAPRVEPEKPAVAPAAPVEPPTDAAPPQPEANPEPAATAVAAAPVTLPEPPHESRAVAVASAPPSGAPTASASTSWSSGSSPFGPSLRVEFLPYRTTRR